MPKYFKVDSKIKYNNQIYRYNRSEHDFLIFKSVDNNNEIKFHSTTIGDKDIEFL